MHLHSQSQQFLQAYFGHDLSGVYVCDSTNWQPQPAAAAVLDPKAGWYWCPARLSGLDARGQRVLANAISVHALVIDDVGTKIDREAFEMFASPPTTMVETSVGNMQAGYFLPGVSVAEFDALRARVPWKADGMDCIHWWRLPGGVHPKNGFATRLVANGAGKLDWLPQGAATQARVATPAGAPQTATVGQVRDLLRNLPNDASFDAYEDWIAVGMAIKGALGEEGRDLWIDWCGARDQTVDVEEKWDSFAPTSAGWGALEIMAKKRAPQVLADVAFDDGSDGDTMGLGVAIAQASGLWTIDDFLHHRPSGRFISKRSGDLWPGLSVDAEVPHSGVMGSNGKELAATTVIKRTRQVHQISWVPGAEKVLKGYEVREGGLTAVPGSAIYNLYEPAAAVKGNPQASLPWTAHVQKLYPNDAGAIIDWFAFKVQFPGIKLNHALFLGGPQGNGKDTLIDPLVLGVGRHNFHEVSPRQLMDRFTPWKQAVVLRVNEAHDLGEGQNRVKFYNTMKPIISAPPATLQVERKGIDVYSIPNVVGVIITSNYKLDGLYLAEDDRRHYIAWTNKTHMDMGGTAYFDRLWKWLEGGGREHVVAFLKARDLRHFNPAAEPFKTRAFWSIAQVSKGSADEEISDVIEAMGSPEAFAWVDFLNKAPGAVHDLAKINARALAAKIEREGYEKVNCPTNKRGHWRVGERTLVIYARRDLAVGAQEAAAEKLARDLAAKAKKPF